jgi:hypothetical protein
VCAAKARGCGNAGDEVACEHDERPHVDVRMIGSDDHFGALVVCCWLRIDAAQPVGRRRERCTVRVQHGAQHVTRLLPIANGMLLPRTGGNIRRMQRQSVARAVNKHGTQGAVACDDGIPRRSKLVAGRRDGQSERERHP